MISLLLVLALCLIQFNGMNAFQMNSFNRFAFANTLKMTSTSHSEKPAIVKGKTWPGTRPPVSNPMLEDLKMDASWGRGKFRDEIWEDQLSPLNEWWRAYEPSDEEYEAIALGYDFTNAKQWFEVRTAKELPPLPSPPSFSYDLIFPP